MDKIKNCSACSIKLVKLDKTLTRKREQFVSIVTIKRKNINKTLMQNQQPKIDNVNNNNRTLLVGPSFWGKTYLMLKIFSRIPDRDVYIVTNSPPDQYSNSKIKIKEIEEMKPLNEYENAIIVFNDILGSSNSRDIDQFFIRGRHNNLDIYLSQFYFDLPKRTL